MTRKVTLYIACSVDGFIAGQKGELDFLTAVEKAGEDYGYNEFIQSIDTVIMGRKTYDKVLSFGIEFPHKGRKVYVLSNSRNGHDENVEFYSGDLSKLIADIRKQEGKGIFVDGGAETIHELMKLNLIDEYVISTIPMLLGNGIPLFKSGSPEIKLKLDKSVSFDTGLVQNWHSVIR